jgi:hypothetical protein
MMQQQRSPPACTAYKRKRRRVAPPGVLHGTISYLRPFSRCSQGAFAFDAAAQTLPHSHAAGALDAQRRNCCSSSAHSFPGSASATNRSRGTFQQHHGQAHYRPAHAATLTVGCGRDTPSDWYHIICCRDEGDDVSSTADVRWQMQAIQTASECRAPVLPVLSLLLAAD